MSEETKMGDQAQEAQADQKSSQASEAPVAGSQETQGQPSAASSAQGQGTQSGGSLSLAKDPEFQRMLNSQLSKREREWQKRFDERDKEYTRRLEALTQSRPAQENRSQLSHEQMAAAEQLADLLLGNPAIRKKYGLEVQDIREELEQLRAGSSEYAIQSELDNVARTYAERFAMTPDQIKEELIEFMENDPVFGDRNYTKGIIEHAARAHFFERSSELAQRAADARLLKEKEKQSKPSLQGAKGTGGSDSKLPATKREFIEQEIDKMRQRGESLF